MKTRIYICALAALFMIPLAVTAQTKKKAKKEVAIQLYSVRDILNKVDNKKSIAEIAQEVVAGKWGNGSERKQRLEAEGYDYAEVQAKVNETLR